MNKALPILILLLSLVGVLVSCRRSSSVYSSSLRYTDSLMEISPDHILNYLGELNASAYSKDGRIYFGLPLTQVTDKNFLPLLPCDSPIDVALDYYMRKDSIHWARVWFHKGRVQRQMKMMEEALKSCSTALWGVEGNTKEELKLKGVIYEGMGGIYLDQLLYQKAFEEFYHSYQCDSLLNDERILMYSLSNMGWVYVVERKGKEALFYLNRVLRLASALNDSIFIGDLYKHMSPSYEDMDSAFIYTCLTENYLTKGNGSISLWPIFGELYLGRQRLDSVEYYLKHILNTSDFGRRVLASYSLAGAEQARGSYRRAFEYQPYYDDNIDSIFSLDYTSDIGRLACKYDSEAKITKEKGSRKVLIHRVCYGVILFVLIVVVIFQRIYRCRKIAQVLYEQHVAYLKERVASSQFHIKCLEAEISSLKQIGVEREQEIVLKQPELRRIIDEKAHLRSNLFKEISIFKCIQELSKRMERECDETIKNLKVLFAKEQVRLEEVLFELYDDHIQYLRATYLKITDDDCVYCCLKLCEMNDQTIAYCFGNASGQIVVQRRLRLKKKMKESDE